MQIDLLLVHTLLPHPNGQNSSAKAMDVFGTKVLSMKKQYGFVPPTVFRSIEDQ